LDPTLQFCLDVLEEIAQLPTPLVQKISRTFKELRLKPSFSLDGSAELMAMGNILARATEGTIAATLIFAKSKGILSRAEMVETGIDLEGLAKFRRHMRKTEGVDLARISGKSLNHYLQMYHELKELLTSIRNQWGDSHPLVRGFDQSYFKGELEANKLSYLDEAMEGVGLYIQKNRH
jgi:hypothetical protein